MALQTVYISPRISKYLQQTVIIFFFVLSYNFISGFDTVVFLVVSSCLDIGGNSKQIIFPTTLLCRRRVLRGFLINRLPCHVSLHDFLLCLEVIAEICHKIRCVWLLLGFFFLLFLEAQSRHFHFRIIHSNWLSPRPISCDLRLWSAYDVACACARGEGWTRGCLRKL